MHPATTQALSECVASSPGSNGLSRALVIVLPMAMKSRPKKQTDPEANADLKRCRRAFRTLDLVDSRLDLSSWCSQVAKYVGEQTVTDWLEWEHGGEIDRMYDFTYDSLEKAMHFSVGYRSWPLATECEWMLPRLRAAISRSNESEPFLVEIGAGPGAAAAILGAALNVPVMTIDSHPRSLGLAEQFAARTGATVKSTVGDIADITTIVGDRVPAAVFGMGIYRHLQQHNHTRESFSDWTYMQQILLAHRIEPHVDAFLDSLRGADLLVAEEMCPDYLAEMASGLFRHGYDIPKGGIKRIDGATPDGPIPVLGVHFTTAEKPVRDPNLLIEMFSPLAHPQASYNSSGRSGAEAEALRWSLEPTELIRATEITYTDGSGHMRHEVFRWDDRLVGQYKSTTRGFRHLQFFPLSALETVIANLHVDEEKFAMLGRATVKPCQFAAPNWGGPLDVQPLFASNPGS